MSEKTDPVIRVAVPGKLMVAGEYAVLETGQPSIVTAVSRSVFVTIEASDTNRLDLPDLGLSGVTWELQDGRALFDVEDSRLVFIGEAIAAIAEYQSDRIACGNVEVRSELDDSSGRKYGLGSSAAVVVGVVAALLQLTSKTPVAPELVFRLAAVAHFRGQGSGSGADVAASTFGGWLRYNSFSPVWLTEELASGKPLKMIIDGPWPHLVIEPLTLPDGLELCVGWTGTPASTGPMLERIHRFRTDEGPEYQRFLGASNAAVGLALQGFAANDASTVLRGLTANHEALQWLGCAARAPIETELLARLSSLANDAGGAGKSSGSGAGDCGVALIAPRLAEELRREWREAGIYPLELGPAPDGVIIEPGAGLFSS
ncbi:phosphomevalonate kinase [Arthrobacter roseus]|uniref:phosphomevalonate kinase n=1 Tax=Arthrobacter roseus TaxID=136274 RepID=UPI0019630F27|nr:phosphomevalonate kinase [Arthrobacter roseus]MBM7849562.1 phosphomevalonate kinase [Arthrobacter roseus]